MNLSTYPGTAVALTAWLFVLGTQSQTEDKNLEWQAFQTRNLLNSIQESGQTYLPFLQIPTLRCGLYVLQAGAVDRQPVHDDDEVYYVVSGKAELRIDQEAIAVESGSVVFVKRGVSHRFQNIEEELVVLVFFSSARPTED